MVAKPALPAELLTSIFQHVHRGSRDTLIACMQSNKQFYEIGFGVLYKHVTLRIKDAMRFQSAIQSLLERDNESVILSFPHTRSLRVIIPGDGRDYGFTATQLGGENRSSKIIRPGIVALCNVLPLLVKMRTFSIMSFNGHRLNTFDETLGTPGAASTISASSSRKPGPGINVLAHLIGALPASVKDLSIDLSELSRYDALSSCDLCPAINRIAENLEHLNLHLRSYCAHLLTEQFLYHDYQILINETPMYPFLKSLIIRIHGFNAKRCTHLEGRNAFAHLDLDLMTRDLRNLLAADRFPALKQCIIISKRRPAHLRQHNDTKWTIYVRELISNQTAAIPRIFLDSRTPQPGNTFIASARTTIRLPSNCSFIETKHWDKEYVGKSGSIRRFVEGQSGWVAFAHGPHVPGMRTAEVQNAYDEGYDVRAPPPSLVSVFRSKHEKTCTLWEDEDAAGARLLEPAVWSGVLDWQVLSRSGVPP